MSVHNLTAFPRLFLQETPCSQLCCPEPGRLLTLSEKCCIGRNSVSLLTLPSMSDSEFSPHRL